MRGLFTKIFLFFWVAQSLTFVITTMLILEHRYTPRPDQIMDALRTVLPNEGQTAANLYEREGCDGFNRYAARLERPIYLADKSTGQFACRAANQAALGKALNPRPNKQGPMAMRVGNELLWGDKVSSLSGRQYIFLLAEPLTPDPHGLLESVWFFGRPQLLVAIFVCGATTFLLVLFLTRPIAKLRAAARDLAGGKLTTRISQPTGERVFGGDEIQGLIHDFNHMADRLESLVDAQKMLLRDVSHELRSPLARLSVALELASEEAPEAMKNHLQRIEREAGRLNILIGHLLRLSSMESTDSLTLSEEFTLASLVETLVPDAEFEAQQRSCTIQVRGTCDCVIRGHSELIYRAIENIVRNAIRYTENGSVIEIDLRCETQQGSQTATLTVSDRGPGVPEDELVNVFRPFYRVDNARQRNTGGFGVGLALAERAVRLHRGEVQAQNRPGGGLIISLVIPCQPAASPRPGQTAIMRPA
jgi:two-component system, OmpR family, sensor histidine kinase CpxA